MLCKEQLKLRLELNKDQRLCREFADHGVENKGCCASESEPTPQHDPMIQIENYALIIIECNNLKSLPERIHTLTALRELRIDGLPNLVSFAERGLLPNLRHFSIQNCERLRVLVREHWGLQQLVSLEEFYIGGRASDDILEMLLKEQLLLPLFTL
ncbi:hypothetical protein L3X38_010306 [Prunus dulcis]|uniref:Uncharacterized protein n=1 Tax=Prunus dulcis TaxID=3755 RepID=A0AAD4WFZ0_PRUDU|nr:hypothetical protein L3X38_010306 [Prunus dulcis]